MMKKINRWMAGMLTALMVIGVFGGLTSQAASQEAESRLQVETPDNRVLTYHYQEAQDFVLNLKNTGETKLTDIKVVPKLRKQQDKWPFKTEYQSYEAVIKELDAGKSDKAVFSFTERDDSETKRHRLTFEITACDEDGKVVIDKEQWSFYVNTTAKPQEQKPGGGDQNTGHGGSASDITVGEADLESGSFSTGDAVYSGGGGAGNGSVPRVIVTGFSTNPAEVKAGSNFTLTIYLKNTSKYSNVSNMLFELVAPTEGTDEQSSAAAFLPSSGSNSIYLEGIAAGGTANISIQLNAKADLVQKPYAVDLTMKYEDNSAAQIDSQASISIPVKQDARFEFSEFEITPETIEVGSEANVSCSLYNLGRIKLYNAKAIFEGDSIKREEVFLGNLEPGSSTPIDVMLEGTAVSEDSGEIKMTLSYENQEGQVSSKEQTLQIPVTEVMEDVAMDSEALMEEEDSSFPILPVVIGIVLIAAIVIGVAVRKKIKKKKLAEEEEGLLDALDRSSEDEQQ